MRIGVVIPTYDQFADGDLFRRIVAAIEDLGYDSAWFGDHIVFPGQSPDYLDPCWLEAMSCAIHGLALTSRLSFGTDVLVAPYRHPLTLAKMASTASVLAPGRLQLGLGIGWLEGEFTALGVPPFAERANVTEDYLKAMRTVLENDGPQSFAGEWVRFDDIQFAPRPDGPLPLLVGGNHAKAVHRAALLGDGWHPLFMTEDDYARGRSEIERLRAEHGITRPFTFSYSCSQTRLLREAGPPAPAHGDSVDKGSSYAPAYPRDATGRMRFMGTAEQLREDCVAFARAGVDQLVLRFAVTRDQTVDPTAYLGQLAGFAREVLPFCHQL
jgi:alkanesulfonate monooxygenase SsuD/methylene tetrahydromethanopterin reductase-like flavin-dependent oxidoreductase (luciferase family)